MEPEMTVKLILQTPAGLKVLAIGTRGEPVPDLHAARAPIAG
jgi:hypothetical protein